MADKAMADFRGFTLFGKQMVNNLIFWLDEGIGYPVCSSIKWCYS